MKEIPFESFGSLLKMYRKRQHLTQRQLANRIGVHHNTIGIWERGNFLPENATMVLEVARQLGLNDLERRRLLEASLTALSPYWYIPYQRNPFFTGRQAILQSLDQALGRQRQEKHYCACALSGLGGIGKTQIALEYTYRHFQEFTAVFWFSAETTETLFASFLGVAQQLQLAIKGIREQINIINAVIQWLNMHRGWLLIFDNVENPEMLQHYLPTARSGSLLFTTRLSDLAHLAPCFELEPLTEDEGVQLLLCRSHLLSPESCQETLSNQIKAEARALVADMGGLPLAIEQAGAYIGAMHCSLENFLRLYHASPLKLLEGHVAPSDHPLSVEGTFALAFEQLRQKKPDAAELLTLLCFLAPDELPEALFTDDLSALQPFLSSAPIDEFQWNALLHELLAYALVRHNRQHKTFTVHRLVQLVLKEHLSLEVRRSWLGLVVQFLHKAFALDREHANVEQWPWCEQLLPHVLAVIEQAEDLKYSSSVFASLQAKVATYYLQRARHLEAEAYYLKALSHLETLPTQNDEEFVLTLTGLGEACHKQGKYQEAEIRYQQALSHIDKHLPQEQRLQIFPFHALAFLYFDLARQDEAEALYLQALDICEQVAEPEHPHVLVLLIGLAALYGNMGRFHEARTLYQRLMHIHEHMGTLRPLDELTLLNDLATFYIRQGKYQEAEPLLQQALDLGSLYLGPEHPEVSAILNNLGSLYRRQARYQEAEAFYLRALQLREQIFGPDHPYVAFFQNNLAWLYQLQGRYEQAHTLILRALQIYEHALNPDHLATASAFITYANICKAQSHTTRAEELYLHALHIFEQANEPLHPDLALTLHMLGNLYYEQGRIEQAQELYLRALYIRQQILIPEHPEILSLQESLKKLRNSRSYLGS
ncbi:helix-turn-helix domain-containing protein [Ktedonosporobacter rubrisoli]|uniref:Helix-turn-helix domain-containing protein n=1 Tax=Ktedonosporobacter rubrisoli TaxID=2509675 RepID=A0A4P6JQH4_KTERU|nr:tetratricopeptide repeat protein [Ktedonosporobacter rubrisoli]QBD77678.1 helix-turn-helix domain-containing protein [Ktedonosporobacter rubrisoli]